jgi:hypothetical protein
VKTDMLAIRVNKPDAKTADKVLQWLLPPQVAGEYYVSCTGLEDDVKRKVYKHQNWYLVKVKIIQVPGFRNVDHKYEIGMNKMVFPWIYTWAT